MFKHPFPSCQREKRKGAWELHGLSFAACPGMAEGKGKRSYSWSIMVLNVGLGRMNCVVFVTSGR